MKSLLIVNIIAQKISLTIQILIAIPELPVYGLPEIFPVRIVTPVCIVMGLFSVLIKDFPDLPKQKKYIEFSGHRFRCTSCGETITEDIPCQCPFTRVTWDMALWIIHLLKCHTSISAISAMLSVHWSTIQKIQKHIMDKALAAFETCA